MTPKGRTPMRHCAQLAALAALALATMSCGDVVRQGRSPMFLVMNSLLATPTGGFGKGTLSGTLFSDVQVLITSPAPCTPATPCPTFYADSGQAVISLAPKDSTVAPTSNNQVTITRYHVEYTRADGRNTPGVDVPYAFDGAVTGTVGGNGSATLNFEIVRHTAKEESPLVQLIQNPQIISSIANVTFYGKDLTGNDISVTGSMLIEFGNFGDQ
jgi:hypothetical protein